MPAVSPETGQALRDGCARFNARQFIEAHETWETAWRRDGGPDRLLLQALIMVAAACVKATRGEPRGTVKLLTSALELMPAGQDEAGLALDEFRVKVEAALVEAQRWRDGGAPLVPAFSLDETRSSNTERRLD